MPIISPSMTIDQTGRAGRVDPAAPGDDVQVAEDALGQAVGPVQRAVPAAEQQLRQQEVDEDHGGHAAGLAHQRHADHQQEHVRQVVQLQEVGAGDRVEQRPDELVADDVVVDLEQHAERGDDEDVLRGPARPSAWSAARPTGTIPMPMMQTAQTPQK